MNPFLISSEFLSEDGAIARLKGALHEEFAKELKAKVRPLGSMRVNSRCDRLLSNGLNGTENVTWFKTLALEMRVRFRSAGCTRSALSEKVLAPQWFRV